MTEIGSQKLDQRKQVIERIEEAMDKLEDVKNVTKYRSDDKRCDKMIDRLFEHRNMILDGKIEFEDAVALCRDADELCFLVAREL